MSQQQWHYSKNGEKHGPITSQKLKELVGAGAIHPADLIWRDGMEEWQPASKVKGLFPPRVEQKASAPPPLPSPSATLQPLLSSPPVVQTASVGQGVRAAVAKWPLWLRRVLRVIGLLLGVIMGVILTLTAWPVMMWLVVIGWAVMMWSVWRNPDLARRQKWISTGVSFSAFSIIMYFGFTMNKTLKEMNAEVDEHIKEIKALNEAQLKQHSETVDRVIEESRQARQNARLRTRDAFKQFVMKKTKDAILNDLGKPDSTQAMGDMDMWYYKGVTYDPITEKIDDHVQLLFMQGRVTNVNSL